MKTRQVLRTEWLMFMAGLLCGSAGLSSQGAEPAPAVPAASPPTQAAKPTAAVWDVEPGARVERLLEELPPSRLMLWDDRVLMVLRQRLAADENVSRPRQQPSQPGSKQPRPSYGDLAPLAIKPEAAGDSLNVYRPEIARLEAVMAQDRALAADYFLHGLIHYGSGRFSVALRDFNEAIRRNPKPSDEFYGLRGLAHYGLGDYRAAWIDLNEAVKRSSNVRNLNNRGAIACALGQTERAIQDFDAALAIRQEAVKVGPVSINRALAMSDLGRHEQAAAELKKVIEAPGDPDATTAANRAAGLVYRRMGDFKRSGLAYDKALVFLELDGREEFAFDALIGRGLAHHELNQIAAAIDDYSKAIGLDPRRAAACVNRAVAYMDRGDLNLAERDLELALRIDPNDVYALGNRGLLKIRQGQTAAGQADLARCVELRKDLQPIIQRISGRGQPNAKPSTQAQPQPFHLRPSPWEPERKKTGE